MQDECTAATGVHMQFRKTFACTIDEMWFLPNTSYLNSILYVEFILIITVPVACRCLRLDFSSFILVIATIYSRFSSSKQIESLNSFALLYSIV